VNHLKLLKHVPDARRITPTQGTRELDSWDSLTVLIDESAASLEAEDVHSLVTDMLASLISTDGDSHDAAESSIPLETSPESIWPEPPSYTIADVRTVEPDRGDRCRRCSAPLRATKAIEVGHTFVLGTRYSEALGARFVTPEQDSKPFEMGCYGIGVSRLVGAIAEKCARENGIAWPVSVAPWKVALVPVSQQPTSSSSASSVPRAVAARDVRGLVDALVAKGVAEDDIVLDDRPGLSFGRRIKDAELVGYPAVLILGRHWEGEGLVEVQVRGPGGRAGVDIAETADIVAASLS
jgi:prolyl-tRNA synthetase